MVNESRSYESEVLRGYLLQKESIERISRWKESVRRKTDNPSRRIEIKVVKG
jgi:hypothetical protein